MEDSDITAANSTCWVKRWDSDKLQEPSTSEIRDTLIDNGALIPLKDQIQYDFLAPPQPAEKLRTVQLRRKGNEGLGFAVRGGLEHGAGIYVSHVVPESQADRKGLKAGDEIIRVNGFTIAQAIHQEALNLIKAKRELVLKVRNVGMVPVRNNVGDRLEWKYVKNFDASRIKQKFSNTCKDDTPMKGHEIRLAINLDVGTSLGCSICCGPAQKPGIFIQSVNPDSLSAEVGLEVGDQILEVNGTSFQDVRHSEAMVALKSSRQLKMKIRKGEGVSLFGPPPPADTSAATTGQLSHSRVDLNGHESKNQKNIKQEASKHATELESTPPKQDVIMQQTESMTPKHDAILQRADSKSRTHDVVLQQAESTHPSQDRLLQQALQAMEEHEKSKHDRVQYKPTQDELWQRRENEALKKEKMSEEFNQKNVRRPPKAAAVSKGSHYSLGYGYTAHKPSFRIQKPVLLCPVGQAAPDTHRNRSVVRSSGSTIPEEAEEAAMSEENFNPCHVFTNEQIAGRQIRLVNIKKVGKDLGMTLKGGVKVDGTGEDRIIIKEVIKGGVAAQQGGLHAGDQLMLVEWTSLVGLTLEQAQDRLQTAFTSNKPVLPLVVAKAPPKRGEDEISGVFVAYM